MLYGFLSLSRSDAPRNVASDGHDAPDDGPGGHASTPDLRNAPCCPISSNDHEHRDTPSSRPSGNDPTSGRDAPRRNASSGLYSSKNSMNKL